MSTDYVYKHKCLNIHLNDDKTQVPALFFLLEYSLFYIGVVSNEILFESTEALYRKWMSHMVVKWKQFPRGWPFVWGIQRSPVD